MAFAFKFKHLVWTAALWSSISYARIDEPTRPQPAIEWRGEMLKSQEGAFYFGVRFQGFSDPVNATGRVEVVFENTADKRSYVLDNTVASIEGQHRELWKVPAGSYRVRRVEFIDGEGVRRVWTKGPKTQDFKVQNLTLSNFGLWTISKKGSDGSLDLKFEEQKNSYKEARAKSDSSIIAVISGFTGRVQENFAGKNLIKKTEIQAKSQSSLQSVSTTTRQISMYMALQLDQDSASIRKVLNSLSVFDPNLRSCYTRRLEDLPADAMLRGSIVFKILISDQTGLMRDIDRTGGTLSDQDIADCLVQELAQIPLHLQKTAKGELKMTFDVR